MLVLGKLQIMKKTVLIVFVCLLSGSLIGQREGTITYERKMDVHRNMQDEQMKAMIPQFRTTKHVLLFVDSISVYKPAAEDEAPDPFESPGNRRVMIRMGPGENGVLYKNFAKHQIAEQTEFAEKNYIIDDTIRPQPWKLSAETKEFLGYTCKKATMTTPAGNTVTAWYTEALITPAGPENFGGLPGAILAIDSNNGEVVFTAIEIQKKLSKKDLAEPKDGKHVTRQEFQKKMEEVLGPPGPGGRRMTRM